MGAPTPNGASQLPNASVEQSHLADLNIGPRLPPEPSRACESVHWDYQEAADWMSLGKIRTTATLETRLSDPMGAWGHRCKDGEHATRIAPDWIKMELAS